MTAELRSDARALDILEHALATVGDEPTGGAVDIVGSDPIFPTPFRIGDMGAAAIAAAALGAARLHEVRTGSEQRVRVDVDAAAAAMRGSRYTRLVPPPEAGRGSGRSGYFRARDGRFVFFRGEFPHHYERELAVLGCGPSREEVTAAVATWDPYELEEAAAAGGAIGAVVRSHEEWADHPQGQAVARLPLLSVDKIADGEPVELAPADRPLGGIRVLDVTRVLAGPTCARTLAEYGADALRIGTSNPPDSDGFMRDTGHGKRHAELDLKSAEGTATIRELVADADVFSQGYRPGSIANLGLSPEEVASGHRGIVYVSISAFGHEGPWSGRRGFDSLIEAATGIDHELADEDGTPRTITGTPLDYTTGYLAAFGALVALRRRSTEGGSYHVRVSLAQSARLLVSLERVASKDLAGLVDELSPARLDTLLTTSDTPYGTLSHLAPIAQLSITPGRWDLPTVPLGHDRAVWA